MSEPGQPGLSSYRSVDTLISAGAKVQELMVEYIDRFFTTHLDLPQEEAVRLHREYYQTYGLSIEGLVRHHQIDPMEYNSKVDDAIPLDGIIKPNPELTKLLADIDRSKVKLWLFTNAYINHARRVVRLLEVGDYFEGVTYCDYNAIPLVCKPHTAMYKKAMKEAGVEDFQDCFFVGEKPCWFFPFHKSLTEFQMIPSETAKPPRKSAGQQPILSRRRPPRQRHQCPSTRLGAWKNCGRYSPSSSSLPSNEWTPGLNFFQVLHGYIC